MTAIIWHDPQANRPPVDFEDRLCATLANRVEAAYLFGSYGTPDFGPQSDVDLVLVLKTDLPFLERPRLFDDLYQLQPNLDLLVYSPSEFESLLSETTGFWASVKENLRSLPVSKQSSD
jgi:predicted nucleotidyltransferase